MGVQCRGKGRIEVVRGVREQEPGDFLRSGGGHGVVLLLVREGAQDSVVGAVSLAQDVGGSQDVQEGGRSVHGLDLVDVGICRGEHGTALIIMAEEAFPVVAAGDQVSQLFLGYLESDLLGEDVGMVHGERGIGPHPDGPLDDLQYARHPGMVVERDGGGVLEGKDAHGVGIVLVEWKRRRKELGSVSR